MSAATASLLLLALAQGGLTAEATVRARSDAGGVQVGEPFTLEIVARHPPGSIALLPHALPLPDALAERSAAREHDRRPGEAEDVDVYRLELLAFESGTHTIGAIPLALGATTAETRPIDVTVTSVLSEDEQLVASSTRPEALAELERLAAQGPPAEAVLVPDYTPIWVVGGAILLVAAALMLLRLSGRRREAPRAEPPPPPPRPAFEVAEEALQQLEAEDPLGQGDYRRHYTELSFILRRYVGGRYGFESLELTYDELLAALRARRTPGLDHDRLEEVLFTADQVKFAKFVPVREDGQAALQTVWQLVRATRPAPEPTAEAAAEPPQEGGA